MASSGVQVTWETRCWNITRDYAMSTENMSFEEMCDLFGYEPKRRPIDTNEVSEITGIRPNTLEIKRLNGTGPRYFKPAGSRKVLYAEREVLAWVIAGSANNTSEYPTHQKAPPRATA